MKERDGMFYFILIMINLEFYFDLEMIDFFVKKVLRC